MSILLAWKTLFGRFLWVLRSRFQKIPGAPQDVDALNAFVAASTGSGKAVLVRWVGSDQCACCHGQAPAWRQVAEAFRGHPVAFGDINLEGSEGHGPDTFMLRYFTNRTSLKGVLCPRSTAQHTCVELAAPELTQHCVEHAVGLPLCRVGGAGTCSEAQARYIEKWRGRPAADAARELRRLEGVLANQRATTVAAAASGRMRQGILGQLAAMAPAEGKGAEL